MRAVVYLGILLLAGITAQVALELRKPVPQNSAESEIDTVGTRYKIDRGRLYFLDNNSNWVEKEEFVWRGADGNFYRAEDKTIYQSDNGIQWKVAFHFGDPFTPGKKAFIPSSQTSQ